MSFNRLQAAGVPAFFAPEEVSSLFVGAPIEKTLTIAGAITWYLDHHTGKARDHTAAGLQEARVLIASHLMTFIHHNIWTFQSLMRQSVLLAVEFPASVRVRAVNPEGKAYDVPLTMVQRTNEIPRFVRKARVTLKGHG
jgi:hypothetical protein